MAQPFADTDAPERLAFSLPEPVFDKRDVRESGGGILVITHVLIFFSSFITCSFTFSSLGRPQFRPEAPRPCHCLGVKPK